jgi:hypothetical protein
VAAEGQGAATLIYRVNDEHGKSVVSNPKAPEAFARVVVESACLKNFERSNGLLTGGRQSVMATPRKDPKDKLPVGRPRKTEVDPAIAKLICDNIECAIPLGLAAESEGVGRRTVYDWLEQFPKFSAQVTRARARGAKNLVIRSLEGGSGAWQATRLLARLYPEDYGSRSRKTEQSEVKIVIEGGLPKRPQ